MQFVQQAKLIIFVWYEFTIEQTVVILVCIVCFVVKHDKYDKGKWEYNFARIIDSFRNS